MDENLNQNFGEVKPKHSSEKALERWRNLSAAVKNPKRRFRFTATAMCCINQSNRTRNDHQAYDNEENTLGTGLLLTATATAAATTTGSDKYRRIWRRTISVGILITVKKPLYDQESQRVIDVPSVDGVERLLGSNSEVRIDVREDHQVHRNTNNEKRFFLQPCNIWTISLLLVSAGFAFAIDIKGRGLEDGWQWHDAVGILIAVVLLVAFLQNFGDVLQRWRNLCGVVKNLCGVVRNMCGVVRNLCGVVKNLDQRLRFTANLSQLFEAAAMRRTNQSNTMNGHQACDNEENTLGAGLLFTAAAAATTTTTGSDKYRRMWRRSIGVGILVTIKKPLYDQESPQPSPSYAPIPRGPVPTADSEQPQHILDVHSVGGEETGADEDRNKVAQIVRERNLNSLRKLGDVDGVARLLGSNLEAGIDANQGQRMHRDTNNNPVREKSFLYFIHLSQQAGIVASQDQRMHWDTNNNPVCEKGFLYFFLGACSEWTIILLLVSAGFAFAIDIKGHGLEDGWHDGVAILVAVVLLVAFPSIGNFYNERKRVMMLKNITELEVNVVRNGEDKQIAISDVVEGDVVRLKKDDRIPADGLFVQGENLVVDEVFNSKIDRDQNPFLVSGSKVVEGHGTMLVTSVGENTAIGKALSLVAHDPNEKTLLQARIEEPNDYIEMFALCVTVLIALVLLIRLFCGKHNGNKDLPELKRNASVDMLMKIFKRISMKSKGKIWILTSALTAIVVGIEHGMYFVITVSLSCWNKKVQIYGADPQNLSACGTMGLVTVICIDATNGLICNQVDVDSETSQVVLEDLHQGIGVSPLQKEIRSLVANFSSAGVCVKLISEDELSAVIPIACEYQAIKGEEIREVNSSERMRKLNRANVIGSCLPEDKLLIIQELQNAGHIVAFFGGLTTIDALALKEANVGITARTRNTELARKSCDIIVKEIGSLFHILKFGRCAYYNIQKFIQLQLTTCISGFIIALVATTVSGASPITGYEMFWVNGIVCLVGSQVLLMELKSQELLTQKPANKGTLSLITKAMWGNIAVQVIYQVSVLLIFQFKGEAMFSMNDDVQKTMYFNMFSLCQIFNLLNAMDLKKKQELKVVVCSYCFSVTLAAVMTMQVVLVEYLGNVTNFVGLNAVQWASCYIVAALPWGCDLALQLLGDILSSFYSNDRSSNRMRRPRVFHFGVPFPMFLFHVLLVLFAMVNQYGNLPEAYK